MELCALHVLAQADQKIGFDRIIILNHIDAYFQSVRESDDSIIVFNHASDFFVNI